MAFFRVPFQFPGRQPERAPEELQRNFQTVEDWVQRYAARVWTNGGQTIPVAVSTTTVDWTTLDYADNPNDFDLTNDRYVCPADGLYFAHARVDIDSANPGRAFSDLRLNGTPVVRGEDQAGSGGFPSFEVMGDLQARKGDFLTVSFVNLGGGPFATAGGKHIMFFSVRRVGPLTGNKYT